MLVHDRNTAYRRGRLWVPVSEWTQGLTITAITSALGGFKVTAGTTVMKAAFRCPYDLDPQFQIGVKVFLVGDGTDPSAIGTIPHTLLGTIVDKDEAILDTPAGDPDTDFEVMSALSATPHVLTTTSRALLPKGLSTREGISNGAFFNLSITLGTVGGTISGTNFVVYTGLEIDYVPMRTRAPHADHDAPYGADFR